MMILITNPCCCSVVDVRSQSQHATARESTQQFVVDNLRVACFRNTDNIYIKFRPLSLTYVRMDTFYITPEEFWNRFNAPEEEPQEVAIKRAKLKGPGPGTSRQPGSTSYYSDSTSFDLDSSSSSRSGTRYIIMYGRHKPGKKTKTWEDDGYLSLVGQIAYVTDMRGRLLEEPTLLGPEDLKAVEDMAELLIGKTEVQVIEEDRK